MKIKSILITALLSMILCSTVLQTTAFAEVGENEYDAFIPGGNGFSEEAFTPSGSATVIDNVLEKNGKEFYTITTEAGNVFYLVVDRLRDGDNVYFLNAVTEEDLIALAEKSGMKIDNNTDFGGMGGGNNSQESNESQKQSQQQPEKEEKPAQSQGLDSNTTTLIYVGVAVLIVGIIGFYVKIVRPKKKGRNDDDFEDFEEDDSYNDNTRNEPDNRRNSDKEDFNDSLKDSFSDDEPGGWDV